MKIQQNVLLSDFCTFKTGGFAKYFVVVKNIDDLKQAVDFAKQNQLPVFVLGGGSNLLISDEGVNGLVMKMDFKCGLNAEICGTKADECVLNKSNNVQVIVGAGEIWDDFVAETVNLGLTGLENLSLIPGTVGASAVQNIGAYGVEAKDVIAWVEVFDIKTGEIKNLNNKECLFSYRDSIFKKPEGKNFVVTKVAYNLQKFEERGTRLKTDYKDIQASLRDSLESNFSTAQQIEPLKNSTQENRSNPEITPKQLREIIIQIRQNKLPDWKKLGTAGSFFKNPIVTKEQLEKILEKYPEIPHYEFENNFKISIAYILDKILNLKGFKQGNVGIFEKHSLILVNHGNATSTEITNLAQKIKQDVKQKTGLDIDWEVVSW